MNCFTCVTSYSVRLFGLVESSKYGQFAEPDGSCQVEHYTRRIKSEDSLGLHRAVV